MKKFVIGSLVAGLLLFIWQFLSWAMLDLHGSQMDYHPNQDAVLEALEANLEEGTYFLPRAPRTASTEERQAAMEGQIGEPWALVSYHESLEMNQGMNMLRGFLLDMVAAFILCWVLLNFRQLDIKTSVMACVAIGILGYLTITYLNSVYFPANTWPDLIDAIVPWAVIGVWFGWWLPR